MLSERISSVTSSDGFHICHIPPRNLTFQSSWSSFEKIDGVNFGKVMWLNFTTRFRCAQILQWSPDARMRQIHLCRALTKATSEIPFYFEYHRWLCQSRFSFLFKYSFPFLSSLISRFFWFIFQSFVIFISFHECLSWFSIFLVPSAESGLRKLTITEGIPGYGVNLSQYCTLEVTPFCLIWFFRA
jgi:hypothetical protein